MICGVGNDLLITKEKSDLPTVNRFFLSINFFLFLLIINSIVYLHTTSRGRAVGSSSGS